MRWEDPTVPQTEGDNSDDEDDVDEWCYNEGDSDDYGEVEDVGAVDDTYGYVISAGDMDKVFAGQADDIGIV